MKKIMMVVCFASIIFATASCDNKNENWNFCSKHWLKRPGWKPEQYD